MIKCTSFTEGVTALSDYRIRQYLFTDAANGRWSFFSFLWVDLKVLFTIIYFNSHQSQLFALLLCFKLLVELPSWLVIRTIMDEDATVSEVAPACLVPVLAALRVIVDSCCITNKGWGTYRAQSTWELLMAEIFLSLLEIVVVAMKTAVEFGVEFALFNTLADLDALCSMSRRVISERPRSIFPPLLSPMLPYSGDYPWSMLLELHRKHTPPPLSLHPHLSSDPLQCA